MSSSYYLLGLIFYDDFLRDFMGPTDPFINLRYEIFINHIFPLSWNILLFHHPRNHFIIIQKLLLKYAKDQGLANHGTGAKSSPLPGAEHKVLSKHTHTHSFMFCLWFLSHLQRQSSTAQMETEGPAKPKIFIIWPFTETFANH